jgi:hypothetical protein
MFYLVSGDDCPLKVPVSRGKWLQRALPSFFLRPFEPGLRVSSFARALIVAGLTFMSGLLGFFLQRLLPARHEMDASGVTGSIIGLVTLLFALALGLLMWMSCALYANQNTESQSLGPLILKLDFVLGQYGPEARRGRDLLRAAVARARDRFWGEGRRAGGVSAYAQARADLQDITTFFAALEPATDQQKQLIAVAMPIFMQVVETTLLLNRRLTNRVPKLLIVMVIGWSSLLFMSYGLLGTFNAFSVAAVAVGSIAVSSTIFMILEFGKPYSGLVRISPAGIDNLIATLGR